MRVSMRINGRTYAGDVEARTLLSDFIRHQAGLTGTHVGCEQGVCGACTILLDGEPIRACLMLAIQANGRSLATVEGLAGADGGLTALQRAFTRHHALQCGFCTAGFLMTGQTRTRRRSAPNSPATSVAVRVMRESWPRCWPRARTTPRTAGPPRRRRHRPRESRRRRARDAAPLP